MTFQQREFGMNVKKSDMLKQVVIRERKGCLLKLSPRGDRNRSDGVACALALGLVVEPTPRVNHDHASNMPAVQCSRIGNLSCDVRRPTLALKAKPPRVIPSLQAYRDYGVFNISSAHLSPEVAQLPNTARKPRNDTHSLRVQDFLENPRRKVHTCRQSGTSQDTASLVPSLPSGGPPLCRRGGRTFVPARRTRLF